MHLTACVERHQLGYAFCSISFLLHLQAFLLPLREEQGPLPQSVQVMLRWVQHSRQLPSGLGIESQLQCSTGAGKAGRVTVCAQLHAECPTHACRVTHPRTPVACPQALFVQTALPAVGQGRAAQTNDREGQQRCKEYGPPTLRQHSRLLLPGLSFLQLFAPTECGRLHLCSWQPVVPSPRTVPSPRSTAAGPLLD